LTLPFAQVPPSLRFNPAVHYRAPYPDAYLPGSDQDINAAGTGAGPWTYTFATTGISNADPRRSVVIACCTNGGTTGAVHNSLTANAGAVVFTRIATYAAGTNVISLWEAVVAAGTTLTAPILTIGTGNPARVSMRVHVHGRGTTVNTPIQTFVAAASASLGGTIDVPASGMVIAAFSTSTSVAPVTWTGVVEDYDENSSGSLNISGGTYINTGGAETSRSIIADPSIDAGNMRLLACAWGAPL